MTEIKKLDFTKTRTSPIGLDIGFNSVRMIQLKNFGNRTAVVAADEIQLPLNILNDEKFYREQVISSIKEILAKGHFLSRKVVSSVPSSDLIIKSIRIDSPKDEAAEIIIDKQTMEKCGLKPETHEIKFFSAGSIHQGENIKNEIILLAVNKEALNKHVNMLTQAGLIAVGIEPQPCALFRSIQRSMRRMTDKEKACVFVDIGGNQTTVIIGKVGEIIFAKQIDIASEHINQQIASKLGIGIEDALHLRNKLKIETSDDDIAPSMKQIAIDSMNSVIDDLAKEISLCLRYYSVTFRGERPNNLVFTGSEAYENIMINALKKHLDVEVEIPQPLRGFDLTGVDFPSDKRGILCEWAVAAGLSMKNFDLTNRENNHERN
jgi:type IV pilus assembly protein PilM